MPLSCCFANSLKMPSSERKERPLLLKGVRLKSGIWRRLRNNIHSGRLFSFCRGAPFSWSSKMMTPSALRDLYFDKTRPGGGSMGAGTRQNGSLFLRINLFVENKLGGRARAFLFAAFFNVHGRESLECSWGAAGCEHFYSLSLMRRRLLLLKNENCLPRSGGWMFMPSRNRV